MIYSKKILSLILTALMVQSICMTGVVSTSAYETPKENSYAQTQKADSKSDGDFQYNVESEGIIVTGYTGSDTEVVVPAEIEGKPVTAIGWYAFRDNKNIVSVTLPDTITDMGGWTFAYCDNLQTVNIPDGVSILHERLFLNCFSLKSITIPDSVTVLDGWCLERCESLTSVTIPNGVTEINESVFLNCKNLKTVNIPDTVTRLWSYAFCGCESLENITVPGSVTEFGSCIFTNCSALKTVTLKNGITSIGQMFRNSQIEKIILPQSVTYLSNSAFEDCINLKEVTLPNNLETIDNYAFWNCNSLTTVTIPESVTKIGYQVFGKCDNLSSMTIPKNVTDIGGQWFVETPNLKTVTFAEGTTNIGEALRYSSIETFTFPKSLERLSNYAFANCKKLTSITIPATVKQIDGWTFCECENLETVVLPNTIENIPERMFLRCHSLKNVNIPASVKSLDGWCFEECTSFTSFTIPDTVTTVRNQVFQYCNNLETVTIPNSVTSLGRELFNGCQSLKTVVIPHSVTKLEDGIFKSCTALESITIPNSITEFGGYVFENCPALKTVTLENGITNIGQMFRNSRIEKITLPQSVTYLSNSAFEDCVNLSEVTLPSNLETIDNYAFWNCDSLTTVNIPESVTKIGYQVFGKCDNLSSMTIPKNVTDIGGQWFVETPNLKAVTFAEGTTTIGEALRCSDIETFTFPKSLERLSNCAFGNCQGLTSMTIPATVKQIDGWTFYECENLETVVLPNTIENIPERMFLRCHNLKNVNVPASVKSLDGWCFEECTSFTSFTIPDTVTTVHNQVFQYCNNLKTVTIPHSVTTLGRELFNGCTALEQITIPNSVTEIGEQLFVNCNALKTVTLENGITDFGQALRNSKIETITVPESVTVLTNSAFEDCVNLNTVTLPNTLTTVKEYAFYNCESLTEITIPQSVTTFKRCVFEECDRLETVNLFTLVSDLPEYTFKNCYALKSVTLPETLTTIKWHAFENCTALESVYYRNTLANWNTNVTVEDGNECLGGINSNVKMYFFPDSVTLDKTTLRMDFEDTDTLHFTATPENHFGKFTWKSSNSKVVKVTQKGEITAVNEGTATISVVSENGKKATCKVTVNPVPKTLELDKQTLELFPDDTYTLTKIFTPEDAKAKYTWASADSNIATVDNDGKVTAVSAGTTTITLKSNNGLIATCEVTVYKLPDSVTLNKTSVKTGVGYTTQLTATLSPTDAKTKSYTWKSSNETVATVSQDGLVTALKSGKTTVTVTTSNGKTAKCVFTVKDLPETVSLNKTELLMLGVGTTETLTTTLNPTDAYTTFAWRTSNKNVATVSSKGVVTAKQTGTATITVTTANGKKAQCKVTVVNIPESIALDKTELTVVKGTVQTLNKTVTPADAYTSYTWTSSDKSVVSVDSNGTITAKENGTATITVTTDNGKSAQCTVTVKPFAESITLDKTEMTLKVGKTATLTQTVTPADALTSYTWTSSDEAVVSVDNNGIVTAKGAGTAIVTVTTDNGKSAQCTVTATEVESVVLNRNTMTLGVGQSYTLRPTATPDDVEETTFTWKSSNKNIATVTSKGKVTGRAVGKATITVTTDNGKTATCTVVVKQAPTGITLNKTEFNLGVGQMYTIQSTLTPSNSATYQTWTSSDKTVATVNDKGKVTGKKVGTAVITVKTTNGHTATCTVTVKKAPTSVELNKTAVNIGVSQKYTLTATLTPTDSFTYCAWSSSDTSIATVSSSGVVTGKKVGTATITVKTTNGKTAECLVRVKAAPTSISLDKTELSLDKGKTYTLTKTLSPTTAATSYTWTSSDTSVATVNSSGKITAKKAGTATITVTTHNGKTAVCTVTVK